MKTILKKNEEIFVCGGICCCGDVSLTVDIDPSMSDDQQCCEACKSTGGKYYLFVSYHSGTRECKEYMGYTVFKQVDFFC